jgi:hypothetical protein
MSIVGAQMKRMFPRQYGLENVFLPTQPSSGSVSYASLTSGAFRPDATKAKKKATGHWRLRSMRALVEEMLVSNQKCRFKALLQHYCPVVVCLFSRIIHLMVTSVYIELDGKFG